jgi:hypothetical protein
MTATMMAAAAAITAPMHIGSTQPSVNAAWPARAGLGAAVLTDCCQRYDMVS